MECVVTLWDLVGSRKSCAVFGERSENIEEIWLEMCLKIVIKFLKNVFGHSMKRTNHNIFGQSIKSTNFNFLIFL